MKMIKLISLVLLTMAFSNFAGAVTYETRLIYDYEDEAAEDRLEKAAPQSYAADDEGFFRGSIFKGQSCTNCKRGGSIFKVGSCTRCSKDGSIFPGGPCKRCNKNNNCKTCKNNLPKTERKTPFVMEYVDIDLDHQCENFAPFMLGHVDFRLKNGWNYAPTREKLGNYNFRIFGCRRFDKEAFLNEGRIMQKDMQFTQTFADAVSECYKIMQIPEDLCLEQEPSPLPEYVLTAEIVDYFMNICDGYNWDSTTATNRRGGSSEMTVKWKLMNLSQTEVVWEGTTTGYGEIEQGAENGEILLVESAFYDAATNLQIAEGFETQLATRLSDEQIAQERAAMIERERKENPAKCQFKEQIEETKCPICPKCEIIQAPEPVPVVPVEEEPLIIEASAATEVAETGGVKDATIIEVETDDLWVDLANVEDSENLCIVDRPPYDSLSPENLYKVRASVVSVQNAQGKKGAGLIVSDSFVLTSADLISKIGNEYKLKTINGKELTGRAFRVNPTKNVALIMLNEPTKYTPLSLNLDLPEIGRGNFMVLGMLDVDNFADGENYIDNQGVINGYRYTDDKGAEIILDTFVQEISVGGALIDEFGTINGIAHSSKKTDDGMDLFIPTETALRGVGLSICEKVYKTPSPWKTKVYKPISAAIEKPVSKAPETMAKKDRK